MGQTRRPGRTTTDKQIGRAHGAQTAPLIKSSIAFYTGMFKKAADMEWPAVRTLAAEFEANIKAKWPALLEEMQGMRFLQGASR